ncbi:MAG: protein kinase [Gemmatimonadales bacterium]
MTRDNEDPGIPPPDGDRLRQRLALAVGSTLTIERELLGGGMSRVFVAADTALDRKVVIKVFSSAGGVSSERFHQEMLLSASLHHPHIVPILAAGVFDDCPWYSMPFVEGRSLRERMTAEGQLPIRDVLRILRDVGRACSHAHAHGIVHRDIKPENVLLAGDAAMIIDFGIAKALGAAVAGTASQPGLTRVGFTLGTPTYMAPEQASADPALDHRADLYAIGVVAYELLAGRPPFQGASSHEILKAHIADPVPDLSRVRANTPPALVALIERCLAKSPGGRPASAGELVEQFETILGASGSSERVAATGLKRWGRQMIVPALVAVGVVIAIAGARRVAATRGTINPPVKLASVAVLRFVPRGDDSASKWLADGLSDDIAAQLAATPGLRIASRMSVDQVGRADLSPRRMAETLGVKMLLDGVVRREGNELRLIAQLVEGPTGEVLWTGSYRGAPGDAGRFVEQVLGNVRGVLLDSTAAAESTRHEVRDPAAYADYLRGRALLGTRRDTAIVQAVTAFEASVRRDSTLVAGWSGLAEALMLLPLYANVPARDVAPAAERALAKALALRPEDPGAILTRGLLLRSQWRWAAAEADLRHAVVLTGTAAARQALGELLLVAGRNREALTQFDSATAIEPSAPLPWALAGVTHALLLQRADADRTIARARAADSANPSVHFLAGAAMLYLDRDREAVAELQLASRLAPRQPLLRGLLAQALARRGDIAGARRERDALRGLKGEAGAAGGLLHAEMAVGDTTAALDALERAVKESDPMFTSEPLSTPLFRSIAGLSRTSEALRLVGLLQKRSAPGGS